MHDFRQLCPSCKQILELPDSAKGRLAQCPVCETTFTAGDEPTQTTNASQPHVQTAEEHPEVESRHRKAAEDTPLESSGLGEKSRQVDPPNDVTVPISPISSGLANPTNLSSAVTPFDSNLPLPNDKDFAAAKPETQAMPQDSPGVTSQSEANATSATESENRDSSLPFAEHSNPFSQPLLQEYVTTEPASTFVNSNEISNKYSASRGEISIVSCSTSELFKTTWAIMLARGLTLFASLLILLSVLTITLVIGAIGIRLVDLLTTETAGFIFYCVAATLVSTLTTIAFCRNAIGVARNTPHLVSESLVTAQSLINTLVPTILIAALASFYKWLWLPSYTIDLTVVVLVSLFTIGTLGWFWSSIFLCADMQCAGFKSLVMSARIFYNNKLSTLALVSTCTGLLLFGVASKGILLIFAIPYIQLLLATSYLMMTNQPFANPRYFIATD